MPCKIIGGSYDKTWYERLYTDEERNVQNGYHTCYNPRFGINRAGNLVIASQRRGDWKKVKSIDPECDDNLKDGLVREDLAMLLTHDGSIFILINDSTYTQEHVKSFKPNPDKKVYKYPFDKVQLRDGTHIEKIDEIYATDSTVIVQATNSNG